jgi:hypothetical protein
MNNTTFVNAPPPANTMEGTAKFMMLLNEKWPIERTANFGGNHSIVYDTTGLLFAGQPKGSPCMVVSVWIFKQLEWRCYPIGLTPEDLALTPEGLVAEIARVLEPETAKLIVPATSRMQVK